MDKKMKSEIAQNVRTTGKSKGRNIGEISQV